MTTEKTVKGKGRPKGTTKEFLEKRKNDGDGTGQDNVEFEEMPNIENENEFKENTEKRDDIKEQFEKKTNEETGGENNGEEFFDDSQVNNEGEGEGDGGGEGEGEGDGGGEGEGEGDGGGQKGDIPPHTKKEMINKTAELATNFYQRFLPVLPKMIAKTSESKLMRMEMTGEINTKMEITITRDNETIDTTVGNYIHSVNDKIDNDFTIDDKQALEFKECLERVLTQKQLALTPEQQLMATIGSHIVTMLASSVAMKVEMSKNIQMFKEEHLKNVRANQTNNDDDNSSSSSSSSSSDNHSEKKNDNEEEHIITVDAEEVKD